jgi:thymidylate synthase ThyX
MRTLKPSYEILTQINGMDMLKHIEKIARVCYKSEDKITEDGESAKKMCKMLISRGHEAMIEHSSLCVKFTVDRGVSHELVRHRIASFAQESTRYCNYSNDKFGNNITYIDLAGGIRFDAAMMEKAAQGSISIDAIMKEWEDACSDAAYSNRQQEYGRIFGLNSIYTPQAIVNGRQKLPSKVHRQSWRFHLPR